MHILVLQLASYGVKGGIELYNRDVIDAFAAMPDVTKITVLSRQHHHNDIRHMPAKVEWVENSWQSTKHFLAAFAQLMTQRPRLQYIYCAHINLMPIARLARAISGAPIGVMLYGVEAWKRWPRRLSWGFKGVDHVAAISEFTRDRFVAWSGYDPARVTLMPNGIDLKQFGKFNPRRRPDLVRKYDLQGKKVVMIFGRMNKQERRKGFYELIDALPDLIAADPHIVLMLCGEGDDRPHLTALVEEKGLRDHVRFTGMVPEADKPDYYRLADAYVMPSSQEGFGYVLLEAMAVGAPAVGSVADGSRDAVRNGKLGALCDPTDRASVVAATQKALASEKKIPVGLDYFAIPEFQRRFMTWIRSGIAQAKAGRR